MKQVAKAIDRNVKGIQAHPTKALLDAIGDFVALIGSDLELNTGSKSTVFQSETTFTKEIIKSNTTSPCSSFLISGVLESLRALKEAVFFTQVFLESGPPEASLCHGPQLLISAEVLGRCRITCANQIRNDIVNLVNLC